jgi:predicted cobalt transporter CbtA
VPPAFEQYARGERHAHDHVPHPGAVHGSPMLTRTWAPAATWQREIVTVLRSVHWDRAEVGGAV